MRYGFVEKNCVNEEPEVVVITVPRTVHSTRAP
jgi:hypothetical protein